MKSKNLFSFKLQNVNFKLYLCLRDLTLAES